MTPKKIVGLKFLLKDAHWLMPLVWEDEAEAFVSSFGSTKDGVMGRSGSSVPPGGVPWAIRCSEVLAMHIVDLQQLEQQQRVQQAQSYQGQVKQGGQVVDVSGIGVIYR
jgi:hypothetical protein